jgi:hypothetical protein
MKEHFLTHFIKHCLLWQSALHYSDKIPEINNLKEGRFILFHSFRDFGPRSADPTAFGPVARQNLIAGSMW